MSRVFNNFSGNRASDKTCRNTCCIDIIGSLSVNKTCFLIMEN